MNGSLATEGQSEINVYIYMGKQRLLSEFTDKELND